MLRRLFIEEEQRKMTMKYRFKFLDDAQEERAPSNPAKGGFEVHKIAAGSERVGTMASLNFWGAKGIRVEILEKWKEENSPPAAPRLAVAAFGIPLPGGDDPVFKPMTKRALNAALEEIESALTAGNSALAISHLNTLKQAEIDEPLADLDDDNRTVLYAAIQDVQERGELAVNQGELLEAVGEAKIALLPPTRRPRR